MKKEGGFVAIMSLLIVAAVIAWIIFADYDVGTPSAPRKTDRKSYVETRLEAVDRAKEAKEALEKGWGPAEEI